MSKKLFYIVSIIAIFILSVTLIVACNPESTSQQPDRGGTETDWTVSKPADCENDGLRWKIDKDGNRIEEVIPALGHDYSDWKIEVQPTETSEGKKARKCSRCDSFEEKAISALVGDGTQGLEYRKYQSGYYVIGAGEAADAEEIIVPSEYLGVRVYGLYDGPFANLPNLKHVSFSPKSTLAKIHLGTFDNSTNLEKIDNIPATVNFLVATAFSGCDSLQSIEISADSTNYTSVDGIVYTKDMTELVAYPNAKSGEYHLPDSVSSLVHQKVFSLMNAPAIESVSVSNNNPNGFLTNNGVLFEEIDREDSVYRLLYYPSGKTDESYSTPEDFSRIIIDEYAFYKNRYLKEFIMHDNSDPRYSYNGSVINDYAFRHSSVEKVTFYGRIEINFMAFSNCDNLKTIDFDADMLDLELFSYAFYSCSSLENVTLPKNAIPSIGKFDSAFAGCTSLQNIFVHEENAHLKSVDGILVTIDGKHLLDYPNGKNEIKIPDSVLEVWCDFSYMDDAVKQKDEQGTISADGWVIGYDSSKETIVIPEGTKGIGYKAFKNCNSTVVFPTNPVSISRYAFGSYKGTLDLSKSKGLKNVGLSAFYKIVFKNENLDLGTPLYIDSDAFQYVKGVKSIAIGTVEVEKGNETHIIHDSYLSYGTITTDSLEKIVIGKYVGTIDYRAFESNRDYHEVETVIIDSAFYVNSRNFNTTDLDRTYLETNAKNLYISNDIVVEEEYAWKWDYDYESNGGIPHYEWQKIYPGGLQYFKIVNENVIIDGKSYKHFVPFEGIPYPWNQ